jgi:AraC-like DNA-binding protein/mannose-6-phosphate isomerase-like protein (cupin superfamily)
MSVFQPIGTFARMRNIPIDSVDHIPREVIAIGSDYPDGTLLPWHSHRRAQLLYGAVGVMQVSTEEGAFVVPRQRAVWIPAGKPHKVRMLGVSTRSLYIEPAAAPRVGERSEVLEVSPLLRHLLIEAVDTPPEYALDGRDGMLASLLLHEVARAPALPLHIPLPADSKLAERCLAFLQQPNIHDTPEAWASALHVSPRSFSRWFRAQTSMSFLAWRQRACVVLALSRLVDGEAVTAIALDLGYDSPGAFSTMFKRVLGESPSAYVGAKTD